MGPRRNTAHLQWDTKPKREISLRDLEFQTAEIVYPNPVQAQQKLPLLASTGELDAKSMNRLIWGDNLLAMQALISEGYRGSVDLIYIDPPFASTEDYYYRMNIGGEEITKAPSIIERLAYKDFGQYKDKDSYLNMLHPRLKLMKSLLAEDGSLFVHLGPGMSHYVKVMLDEIFGESNLVNEIAWCYRGGGVPQKGFARKHDTIFFYARGDPGSITFNPQYVPYSEASQKLVSKRGGTSIDGKVRDLERGAHMPDWWADINSLQTWSPEKTGFDTQKPEPLLRRIILAASAEGDLIGDFFCGSGTTGVAAEKLGRRWIMSDFSKVSIQVTRNRLVEGVFGPFVIQNVGNYQRELIYARGARISEMQRVVMKLFGASQHPSHSDLGVREADGGERSLVFVGYPDRPVTAKKVLEVARLATTLDGSGYKRLSILGWDYDYNFDAALEALGRKRISVRHAADTYKREFVYHPEEGSANLIVEPRTIPHGIYEYLKGVTKENSVYDSISFHEKPYLRIAPPIIRSGGERKSRVSVALQRFVLSDIPMDDLEQIEQIRQMAKDNFAILIDYWAVDWDYDGTTFRSRWQDCRGNGRNAKTVTKTASSELENGRAYRVLVRVVDVFGNDASAETSVKLQEE